MTEITYTCQFCGARRSFECDLSECPPLQTEAWLKMLACNPCSDFERLRRDLMDGAEKYAIALSRARTTIRGEKLKDFESRIAERLTAVTKKYASIVCRHRGLPCEWDADFVMQIMEKPANVFRVMKWYFEHITRYAKNVAK